MRAYVANPEINPALTALLLGGGQAYGTGGPFEKGNLLDRGLELTGQPKPNVLLVASARWKSEAGVTKVLQGFTDYYHTRGASVGVLHPFLYQNHSLVRPDFDTLPLDPARVPSSHELEERTEAADLLFVLGGDTNRMLNQVWRPLGIDLLLRKAIERGAVISGTSAGTIAWFEGGHTDSDSLNTGRKPELSSEFHYIRGLGHISRTVVCPHYDSFVGGRSREKSFHAMMNRRQYQGELGIGIDNDVALEIIRGGLARAVRGAGSGRRIMRAMHYRDGGKQSIGLSPANGTFKLSELVS